MANLSETAVLAGGCFWGMQDLIRQRTYEVTGKNMPTWKRIVRTGPPGDGTNWMVLDKAPTEAVRDAINKLRDEYDLERPR